MWPVNGVVETKPLCKAVTSMPVLATNLHFVLSIISRKQVGSKWGRF